MLHVYQFLYILYTKINRGCLKTFLNIYILFLNGSMSQIKIIEISGNFKLRLRFIVSFFLDVSDLDEYVCVYIYIHIIYHNVFREMS